MGCGAADPIVHLQVVPGPDVETLERFVRLSLEVNRCEGLGVLYSEDVPFMGGVAGPRLALPQQQRRQHWRQSVQQRRQSE